MQKIICHPVRSEAVVGREKGKTKPVVSASGMESGETARRPDDKFTVQNEAPDPGNGSGFGDKLCSEAVCRWQEEQRGTAKEGSVQFLKVAETCMQLRVWGMSLELVLPAGLFQEDIVSDESFLAISTDELAPGNLLIALNEKLERVKKTPGAIPRVLDVTSQTLRAFAEKRGLLECKAGTIGRQNVNRKDMSNSSHEGSDHHEDGEWLTRGNHHLNMSLDTGASDNVSGIGRMAGNHVNFLQVQPHESDEFDETDDFMGCVEEVLPIHSRYADECRRLEITSSDTPCLLDLIEQAKSKCHEARKRGENQLPTFTQPGNSTSASTPFEEDEILQYCTVSSFPLLNCLRIRAEVSGIVSSLKVATALGFTAQGTLQIMLELDEKYWSQDGTLEPLKIERATVTLEDNLVHGFDVQKQSSDTGGQRSSTQKLQDEIPLVREGTCITILLQDMINTFFHDRTSARVNSMPTRQQGYFDVVLQKYLGFRNPIVGLICFVGTQLRALPGCCISCWSPLPMSAGRIRTCQKELCLFKFEELGLGAMTVLQEIKESPALIEFELSMGCAAADSNRDVFEPFPAFLLQGHEIRGRSGNFSDASLRDTHTPALESIQYTRSENKRLKLLLDALQTIPRIEDLLQCADENALRQKLASASSSLKDEHDSKEVWCSKMMLSYNLMRFILSTNRLSLSDLKEDKIPLWLPHYQFVALSDLPEKEARFEQRKSESGSFFAFHGSSQCNWYSIMRNGLRCLSRTSYMSSGAAHGNGIYLASDFTQSYGFAKRVSSGKTSLNGDSADGISVLAICEVINGSCSTIRGGGHGTFYVVPVNTEDDVAVRYIIGIKNSLLVNSHGVHIAGSILQEAARGMNPIDLGEHYAGVKLKHNTMLRERLEMQRREAKLKLNEISMARVDSPSVPNARTASGNASRSSDKNPAKEEGLPRPKRPREDTADAAPTRVAMQAVAKEFKNLLKEMGKAKGDTFLSSIQVTIPNEADMHVWNILLYQDLFKSCAKLYKDLSHIARVQNQLKGNVLLEAVFPSRYPFAPPFIRVVRPKFLFHTGHVTVGGSICMELLTDSGWLPTFSFESVLVQIVNAMVEGDGRIDLKAVGREYSRQEAEAAFTRVARQHRWKVGT